MRVLGSRHPGWLNTLAVRSQCADQAHYTRVRVARRVTTLAQDRNRQQRRVVHRVAKGMHVPTLPFRCSHVTRDARGQRELCALTHWFTTRGRGHNNDGDRLPIGAARLRVDCDSRCVLRPLCAASPRIHFWYRIAVLDRGRKTIRKCTYDAHFFQAHHHRAPV